MSWFLPPNLQYLDTSGDPLDGGLLYFWVAGTSTEKDTYPTEADALAGTNANANPVVLDAEGRAKIVLAPGGVYKVELRNSAGTTIWGPIDNVTDIGGINSEWVDQRTATFVSASSFTLTGDQTTNWHPGRKVKFTDASTLYGIIKTSVYTSLTTLTVEMINGPLTSSLASASVAIQGYANSTAFVDNVTDLKALTQNYAYARTAGYTTAGDGGGAEYWFDSTSSDTDDGGEILQPDSGTGRWKLIYTNKVNAAQFGAVSGVTFTSGTTSAHGGVVSAGTTQTAKIQAAIDAVGEGGIVVISHPYYIATGLTISNGSVLIGEGLTSIDELQDGTLPGLYTEQAIAMVTISSKKSYCRDLMLVGSGDINDGNTPNTEMVNTTGIKCEVSTTNFYNIQFRNLRKAFRPASLVKINFYNCIFRYCLNCIQPDDTDVCNLLNFYGGSAQVCDNVLYNSGSTSAEQSQINFFGFHFEWLVRAAIGDFDSVTFYGCWFERVSTTGLDQSRSNSDNVPFEPLGDAEGWRGDNNHFPSSANGNLSAAGTGCWIGGWHSAAGEYRRLNYGLTTTVTELRKGSANVIFDGEVHNALTLQNPIYKTNDQVIDGDTTAALSAVIFITSAINTPQLVGIDVSATAVKGTVVKVCNNTNVSVPVVDSSGSATAEDQFLLDAGFTLARYEGASFIYSGARWQVLNY